MIQKLDDTCTLHNGVKMPGFGFGTWQSAAGDITVSAVKAAVKAGYRNIDTAAAYHNEKSVGEGIRQAAEDYGIKREELYRDGRVKAIGVSNFLSHHVQALMEDADVVPMVNQIEYHPGFGQVESAGFCQANGIIVQAWSPLGTGDVLKNHVLEKIAAKHGKTTAHICLRWLIQKDIVPLPKSVHEERIISNTQVFDFELSASDMAEIDAVPYCGGMRFDPDAARS